MLLPENPASRFPFLKIGSHPPSLPTHPLPLAPQDEDGRRQGSLGPKHGERPAGQVHSRASVSPRRVTPAQEAPQPDGASPPPQVRRHHLLLLLLAHSGTVHHGRCLLGRCSHPRRLRATSAYVSSCACAAAWPRPLSPPAAGARSGLAHALSSPRPGARALLRWPFGSKSVLLCRLNTASGRRWPVGWRVLILRRVLLVCPVSGPLSLGSPPACKRSVGAHAGGTCAGI